MCLSCGRLGNGTQHLFPLLQRLSLGVGRSPSSLSEIFFSRGAALPQNTSTHQKPRCSILARTDISRRRNFWSLVSPTSVGLMKTAAHIRACCNTVQELSWKANSYLHTRLEQLMAFHRHDDLIDEHARLAAVRKWRNAYFAGLCFAFVMGTILVLLLIYGPILMNDAAISMTSTPQIPAPTTSILNGS